MPRVLEPVQEEGDELGGEGGWFEHDCAGDDGRDGEEETDVPAGFCQVGVPSQDQSGDDTDGPGAGGDVVYFFNGVVAFPFEEDAHDGVCGEHFGVGAEDPHGDEDVEFPGAEDAEEEGAVEGGAALVFDGREAGDCEFAFGGGEVAGFGRAGGVGEAEEAVSLDEVVRW